MYIVHSMGSLSKLQFSLISDDQYESILIVAVANKKTVVSNVIDQYWSILINIDQYWSISINIDQHWSMTLENYSFLRSATINMDMWCLVANFLSSKVDPQRQELCLLRLWCRCGRALQGQGGDLRWNGSLRYHRLFASNPRKVSGNWIGVFLIVDYVDWLSQPERSLGINRLEFRRRTQVLFFEVVLVVVKLWGTENAEVSETWLRLSEVGC